MAVLVDYDSTSSLKSFLESRGLAMQKKFGQNFLINGVARKRLIDELDITNESTVWEIGPGLGAMTSEILNRGSKINVFEIDHGFVSALNEFFGDNPNFSITEGDVLKTYKKYVKENKIADRLFGNLPYNIAATLLADFISDGIRFEKAVVTVQKEVALRMTAKPGSENYSSFSVLCQWAYDTKPIMDLAGGAFWPRPNVDSRAVLFTKRKDWPLCKDTQLFMSMQRALFASRRKTIKNNLTTFLSDGDKAMNMLEIAGIDPTFRAEKLCIEEFLRLSDVIYDNK